MEMKNDAIAGLRVRNRVESGCHVRDDSHDGYRSVTIPVDARGTLTGGIMVFPEGADEEECHRFAADAERIRCALQRVTSSDQEYLEALKETKNWWKQTEALVGEDLIASRIALVVKWDGIAEQEPGTLDCGSYIPWLELES